MRRGLIQHRQLKNMTQTELSIILNISLRQYQRIESGESEGKLSIWKQLSDLFGVSINDLIS